MDRHAIRTAYRRAIGSHMGGDALVLILVLATLFALTY